MKLSLYKFLLEYHNFRKLNVMTILTTKIPLGYIKGNEKGIIRFNYINPLNTKEHIM